MKSIIQTERECFICGTTQNLHEHHLFFGNPNRKNSEKYGLKVWLCITHHTGGNNSAHHNPDMNQRLKEIGQKAFETHHGTREEFRAIFGKSYL